MSMLDLGNQAILRLAKPLDLVPFLEVCLKTSNSGQDGSNLYNHKDLVGDIYAAPYLLYEPRFAYALEISGQVTGYLLGALDTPQFEKILFANYWPKIQHKYEASKITASAGDKILLSHLFNIDLTESEVVKSYPSHLHIDILESGQGRGYGKVMINHMLAQLRAAGSTGVHLHVSNKNYRAQEFYKKLGFTTFKTGTDEEIMGINFNEN